MDVQIFVDLARYAHIVAVAIGFGAAFLTDMHALARLPSPVDRTFVSSMQVYHRTIWFSLIAMWITGVIMVYVRTGFNPANFTPKLFAKVLTVTILTVNARMISAVVMPMIEVNRGQSLMWLPLRLKIKLALVGAVSTSSWMVALALGTSKVLAESGWITFVICLPIVYILAIGLAVSALSLLHLGAQMAPQPVATTALKLNVVADDRTAPLALGRKAEG